MARVPHGYHDMGVVGSQLREAGFTVPPRIDVLAERSRAASASAAAIAFCQGTPLRGMLEARGASALDDAVAEATHALESRFGSGSIDGAMQAFVIEVEAR